MERKEIGKGADSFEKLRQQNGYYVDKTDFIQTVFGSAIEVLLLTRPRRFGKTLTMTTFQSFLSLNPDNPDDVSKQLKLFEGTRILSNEGTPEEVAARKQFVQDHMGKYPVIFLTFKDVDGDDFAEAYEAIADEVNMLAQSFGYLRDSPKLSDAQKREYAQLEDCNYLKDVDHKSTFRSSLKKLTLWLTLHHGVPPVILIDEYDVPLAKAEAGGYYEEMLKLLKGFYGALKTNTHMYKAVLTGCLRISKESIFTGINHFSVNSVFDRDDRYSSAIGFTKQETEAMLEYCDLGEYRLQIKDNYDGYRFGRTEMFCPWDVVSFCCEAKELKVQGQKPDFVNYWTSTSGNDIIDAFADYIRPEHIDDMQTLVDGGSIAVTVRENLNYPDLRKHEIDAFWTMLLYTGYLTLDSESSLNLDDPQQVRIPNLEIRKCFSDRILEHFKSNPQVVNDSIELVKACLKGDAAKVREVLNFKLKNYISIRDFATRAPRENLYHGFVSGCISSCRDLTLNFASNAESGDGYADICFTSMKEDIGVIIELKQTDRLEQMRPLAEEALRQIEDRHYSEEMELKEIPTILAFGICFCHKSCSVSVKKLK